MSSFPRTEVLFDLSTEKCSDWAKAPWALVNDLLANYAYLLTGS